MTFGEKIQNLRKAQGLSQKQLADMVFVSHQAVSRWEQNESIPDVENLMRLSVVFDVTTDYLLKDVPPPTINTDGTYASNDNDGGATSSRPSDREGGFRWHFDIDLEDFDVKFKRSPQKRRRNFIINNIYNIAAVTYLIMGFTQGWWHPGWLVFVAAWVIHDGVRGIFANIYSLAFIAFLGLGFFFDGAWRWSWIAFPVAWLIDSLIGDFMANRRHDRRYDD